MNTLSLYSMQPLGEVTESYYREIKDFSVPSHALPTIDMKAIDLQKLHSACAEWGFFQIVNHGVSASLLAKTKVAIEEFFDLPLEEKLRHKIPAGGFDGYGNIVRGDGKFDWSERVHALTNPRSRRTAFNDLPSFLRDTMEEYLIEMQTVVMKLVKHLGEALGIDVLEMFDDGFENLRMNFYPPCPRPDSVMGFINHSDMNAITVVNQVNGVDGLEVKIDGKWLKAMVRNDALLVNLGDMFEIISNGIYKSVEHRVMVDSKRVRITAAVFASPNFEAEIGPMVSALYPNRPSLFRTVSMEKYVTDFLSRKLAGKSNLDYYRNVNV